MLKLKDYVTAGSLLVSVASITLALEGRIPLASFLVLVAWGFDALDGLVARLTNTRNEFGAHFDDLVDHVAYTLAPAFLAFAALRAEARWLGFAACFLVVLLGTLRLALANTRTLRYPGYWIGLPRPASGLIIVLLVNSRPFAYGHFAWAQLAIVVLVAAAGLTRWPFKNHKLGLRPVEWGYVVGAVAVGLAAYPFGWGWNLGLIGWIPYLVSPWLWVPAAERRAIGQALATGPKSPGGRSSA